MSEGGRVFEDYVVGKVFRHPVGRTVTDTDNIWFTCLTMNTNQVHFNDAHAERTQFGKPLVNSVTGEEERMERVLPLIRKYGAAVVAISNDDTGISEDPDVRFGVAKRIVERAADHGIPREDIVVDPLVMPIGAMRTAGQQVFRLVRRLREELGVNSTCGASNVSFGLPNREGINAAFLPMAIASGLTSAITNPLSAGVEDSLRRLLGCRIRAVHDDGPRPPPQVADGRRIVDEGIVLVVDRHGAAPPVSPHDVGDGVAVPQALYNPCRKEHVVLRRGRRLSQDERGRRSGRRRPRLSKGASLRAISSPN